MKSRSILMITSVVVAALSASTAMAQGLDVKKRTKDEAQEGVKKVGDKTKKKLEDAPGVNSEALEKLKERVKDIKAGTEKHFKNIEAELQKRIADINQNTQDRLSKLPEDDAEGRAKVMAEKEKFLAKAKADAEESRKKILQKETDLLASVKKEMQGLRGKDEKAPATDAAGKLTKLKERLADLEKGRKKRFAQIQADAIDLQAKAKEIANKRRSEVGEDKEALKKVEEQLANRLQEIAAGVEKRRAEVMEDEARMRREIEGQIKELTERGEAG